MSLKCSDERPLAYTEPSCPTHAFCLWDLLSFFLYNKYTTRKIASPAANKMFHYVILSIGVPLDHNHSSRTSSLDQASLVSEFTFPQRHSKQALLSSLSIATSSFSGSARLSPYPRPNTFFLNSKGALHCTLFLSFFVGSIPIHCQLSIIDAFQELA